MSVDVNVRLNAAVDKYIRMGTFPVAVKLCGEMDFPEKCKRPLRDFGHPITLCQGTALARTYNWTVGFSREDHACGNSIVIMGIVEEPELIKDGSIVYPLYTASMEAGAVTQKLTPSLPVGKAEGILLSPLAKAEFEPDVVLFYENPGRIARLIQAALYLGGGVISSNSMGRAACGAEIAVPVNTGKCNVIVPGGGEKAFGQLPDDQICFAAPRCCLEDLIVGLEGTHKAGASRFPWTLYGLQGEPSFPSVYQKLEELVGIQSTKK